MVCKTNRIIVNSGVRSDSTQIFRRENYECINKICRRCRKNYFQVKVSTFYPTDDDTIQWITTVFCK